MKGLSKEEEELLFKDLSQRLHYKVKCNVYGRIGTLTGLNDYGAEIDYGNGKDTTCEIKYCKPYLRSMSSMTEEEKKELLQISNFDYDLDEIYDDCIHFIETSLIEIVDIANFISWLNKNHFDYLNLIEKNLALKAPRDMYKHKLTNYN